MIEGRDIFGFTLFSNESRFAWVPAAGLNGVGTGDGDTEDVEDIEGSSVRDFFNATGLGEMIGGGLLALNCHLSNTEPLR